MGGSWTLEDLPWGHFDPTRVDPEMPRVVKAASMVESNGGDYATYLCNVFSDDAAFQAAARSWAQDEVQRGRALARWAALAKRGARADFRFLRARSRRAAARRGNRP